MEAEQRTSQPLVTLHPNIQKGLQTVALALLLPFCYLSSSNGVISLIENNTDCVMHTHHTSHLAEVARHLDILAECREPRIPRAC